MPFTYPFPPETRCFAANAQDIYCDSCPSGQFQILKGGTVILSEWYDYDASHRVTIRGLANIFSTALYGNLALGSQANAKDIFTLTYGGEQIWSGTVYAMRLKNPHDASGAKTVLCANTEQRAFVGFPCIVSQLSSGNIVTEDKASAIAAVAGDTLTLGNELTLHIVRHACQDAVCIRFLNRYDVPQSLVAQWMEEKPSAADSVALMDARQTRFSVEPSTEYTLHSGPIPYADEYDAWADLLTARKAEIFFNNQWIPILMTKGNYTRRRRTFYGQEVQLSFKMAEATMLL